MLIISIYRLEPLQLILKCFPDDISQYSIATTGLLFAAYVDYPFGELRSNRSQDELGDRHFQAVAGDYKPN
ncbi:hypothetical protein [Leptolyngbya sp. FACHB-541]|uniref:hypothetical protein n=1 Tax=Leptolyngbya sp. FACHB-541 TaxID=2692810 RepID=UPI001F54E1A7|nr:hypothetical protein [Leptolyngbya sp. FACHB-541]